MICRRARTVCAELGSDFSEVAEAAHPSFVNFQCAFTDLRSSQKFQGDCRLPMLWVCSAMLFVIKLAAICRPAAADQRSCAEPATLNAATDLSDDSLAALQRQLTRLTNLKATPAGSAKSPAMPNFWFEICRSQALVPQSNVSQAQVSRHLLLWRSRGWRRALTCWRICVRCGAPWARQLTRKRTRPRCRRC